jgi:O-antigen/teichoic acid export membrane protein
VRESSFGGCAVADPGVTNLKGKSIVGGIAALSGQGAKFLMQTATTIALARLLSPRDFGLQGMVIALTGFLGIFKDAGLATATVQRQRVTHEQTSTLFWVNLAVGILLSLLCAALAPVMVSFYHEPHVLWVAVISGLGFIFSGLGAQHQALLQRSMRFVTVTKIDVLSLMVSSATGIIVAFLGGGYWSLVAMALVTSMVSAAGAWIAVPWRPGRPRRRAGVRSMLHFGWKATCNNLVVFFAWNCEKILLGRFLGAASLGIYGRAFQLVTLPVQQLNSSLTGVAFPALSRIQDDPERLARSFLKGFSLLISLTVPITIICALFPEEMVRILLGAKWIDAAPIIKLLAPTALVFALANPLSWLVMSTGRVGRALSISATTTPLVILGIVLGLSHGVKGVALGYSLSMALLVIPIAAWSKAGTAITWKGLWGATKHPLLAGIAAVAAGLLVKVALVDRLSTSPLLILGAGSVCMIYAWVLLIAFGQKRLYVELLAHAFRRSPPAQEKDAAAEPAGAPRTPTPTRG